MSEAQDKLNHYLHSIGLSHYADAAQQVHISLLRQWINHLDYVLKHEIPRDSELRRRIIAGMIYGGSPTLAEAEMRAQMTNEMQQRLSRGVRVNVTDT